MLKEVDPESAALIHANNIKRTVRALEYYMQTGQKISEHNEKERSRRSAYNACYFVLNDEREKVYERIDRRVDRMLSDGLVKEVQALKEWAAPEIWCPCRASAIGDPGISGRRIRSGPGGLSDQTGHQTFREKTADMVPQGPDVIWLNRQDFPSEDAILSRMIAECEEREMLRERPAPQEEKARDGKERNG